MPEAFLHALRRARGTEHSPQSVHGCGSTGWRAIPVSAIAHQSLQSILQLSADT